MVFIDPDLDIALVKVEAPSPITDNRLTRLHSPLRTTASLSYGKGKMRRIATPVVWKLWWILACALMSASRPLLAQQSWSASVIADNVPVYLDMNTSSEVMTTLPKGTVVAVYFAVRSIQGSRSKIALKDDRQSYGFVLSAQLLRDQAVPVGGVVVSAGSASGECTALVDELMKASGADAAFSRMSGDFVSGIMTRVGNRSARPWTSRSRANPVDSTEGTRWLCRQRGGSSGLVKRCDPVNYSAALEVFQSPFVAQMTKLETLQYRGATAQTTITEERKALLRRLERADGSTRIIVDMMVDMTTIFASTFSGQSPRQADIASIRSEMDRSVSDADLAHYASIAESQPIRQFNQTYLSILREVYKAQSRLVAIEMKAHADSHPGGKDALKVAFICGAHRAHGVPCRALFAVLASPR